MKFGIYVHIPYCLQRCHYCDFATFALSETIAPDEYLKILVLEIKSRATLFSSPQTLTSLYFGGGTPSLLPASHILTIISELANCGFIINDQTEVTIEINPATIDEKKLDLYLEGGVNRFSVGAQTFNDSLLKSCGRRHNSEDTRLTLRLLKERNLNFSFDLLFGLPAQNLHQLERDLEEVAYFSPSHLSAYCLTVPQGHSMEVGRPSEDIQLEMFELIENYLKVIGIKKYEISNFSQPNKESQHNLLYWQDQAYWGLGLSAHSYHPNIGYGLRFWNHKNMPLYSRQINGLVSNSGFESFETNQIEHLKLHEALTDYCHTSLRLSEGLSKKKLLAKFSSLINDLVIKRLEKLVEKNQVIQSPSGWALSKKGERLSNQVFLDLTFDEKEIIQIKDRNLIP